MVKALAFDASGRWLAFAGADSDVNLWDMRMVHDELAAVGLAWDQAASPSVSTDGSRLRGGTSQAPGSRHLAREHRPRRSRRRPWGCSGFRNRGRQQGRLAAAVADLHKASEQFQALRQALPGGPRLARPQGISLRFLAGSLRDSNRPDEALACARESLAVYDSVSDPDPGDLYNMAVDCALVSALLGPGAPGDREELEARAVGYLRQAIEQEPDRFLPQVAAERDLDPLRGRADFRDLMAGVRFPRDPFVQPSPLSPFAQPGPLKRELEQSLPGRRPPARSLQVLDGTRRLLRLLGRLASRPFGLPHGTRAPTRPARGSRRRATRGSGTGSPCCSWRPVTSRVIDASHARCSTDTPGRTTR